MQYTGEMTEDELGNDVPVLSDPNQVGVYSWSVRSEANLDNSYTSRKIQVADLSMPSYAWSMMDQFLLDDGPPYEVSGLRDCTHGWHGWAPGITLELRRVVG